jgi:hypothetical protein
MDRHIRRFSGTHDWIDSHVVNNLWLLAGIDEFSRSHGIWARDRGYRNECDSLDQSRKIFCDPSSVLICLGDLEILMSYLGLLSYSNDLERGCQSLMLKINFKALGILK